MKIVHRNFGKGLWTGGPPTEAPLGTCTRLKNLDCWDDGSLRTRPGAVLVESLANTVDGRCVYDKYIYKDSSGNIYEDSTDLTIDQAGRYLRMVNMQTYGVTNDVFYFPGAMQKYYYNPGTAAWTVGSWGVGEAPSVPTATPSAIAGSLTGNYTYLLTFYNNTTNTESAASLASAEVTVTSKRIDVSDIPVVCGDSQVDYVRIYRTAGTIPGVYYYVDAVPLGTATYEDDVADVGLGDLFDQDITYPLQCNACARHKSRMLLFDVEDYSRYVFPSYGSRPEIYNMLLYEMVADQGDTLVAGVEQGDSCILFGNLGIYEVRVGADNAIYVSRLPVGRGTIGGATVVRGTLGIYFASDDGIYLLTGYTAIRISDNVESAFKHFDRGGLSYISDNDYVSGAFIGGAYYFTYYGADSIWHTLRFREAYQRWTHHTGALWCTNVPGTSHPLVGASTYVGQQTPGITTDNGTDISVEAGLNIQLQSTMLQALRGFRISGVSPNPVTISFYDDTTLLYSLALDSLTLADGYTKHGLPFGTYSTAGEVIISGSGSFVLKTLEVDVFPIRKTEDAYSRRADLSRTGTTEQAMQ